MDTLSIALNLQLNPNGAGGVESNARSLLQALGTKHLPFETKLLILERYREDWKAMAPCFRSAPWRYGESVPDSPGKVTRPPSAMALAKEIYRAIRYPESQVRRRPVIDRALHRIGATAVHFPTSQVFETGLPFIYEPWDLQHLHLPAFFTPQEIARREAQYRWGCENARLVVTATRWTKADIAQKYGIAPDRIVVAPRSSLVARRELDEDEVSLELGAAGVTEPFIFYPAMTFEHKNHLRLFDALTLLRDRHGLRPNLVLSGRPYKPHWPKIAQAIQTHGLSEQVKVLGPVSDDCLTALFRRARFMVFPSLFEGLGLPLLEAFHHGTPVVAADASCVPEVVGEAALLFDGLDVESIAEAIRRGLEEPETLAAISTCASGRLADFSWDECVAIFVACYKTVLRIPLDETDQAAMARGLT